MPGEEHLLAEFAESLNPPILGQLIKSIFQAMKLVGEAGSLLKIEDEIRTPPAEGRKHWEAQAEQARDKKGRKLLFTIGQMEEAAKIPQPRLDLTGITADEFWREAEPRLLTELRRYAASAVNGKSVQRSLFAEDAEQGFAFIDVCRNRYDVILMNPPFGESPSKCADLFASRFRRSRVTTCIQCSMRGRCNWLASRGRSALSRTALGLAYQRRRIAQECILQPARSR